MLHLDLFSDRRGGRNVGDGDIYVSLHSAGETNQGENRMTLSIRFRASCLDKLRWRKGDRVLLGFDIDEKGDASMTFTRAIEDDHRALTLHANGTGHSGSAVRKTITQEQASAIFPDGNTTYAGTLVHGDIRRAVFTLESA
jgi:hypothetical protein